MLSRKLTGDHSPSAFDDDLSYRTVESDVASRRCLTCSRKMPASSFPRLDRVSLLSRKLIGENSPAACNDDHEHVTVGFEIVSQGQGALAHPQKHTSTQRRPSRRWSTHTSTSSTISKTNILRSTVASRAEMTPKVRMRKGDLYFARHGEAKPTRSRSRLDTARTSCQGDIHTCSPGQTIMAREARISRLWNGFLQVLKFPSRQGCMSAPARTD